jgi:hypothetical protein
MTDQARIELESAIHTHVFGRDPSSAELVPAYSLDIREAWKVHQAACDWIYSKRKRYLEDLQLQASVLAGVAPDRTVDGLHVLVVLKNHMPEAICRAALAVVNPPKEQAKPKRGVVRGGLLGREE